MAHEIPTLTPVTSSNVDGVGQSDGHLYVKFKSGGTYRFQNLAGQHHDALIADRSPGRYFHAMIKPFHSGEKVE